MENIGCQTILKRFLRYKNEFSWFLRKIDTVCYPGQNLINSNNLYVLLCFCIYILKGNPLYWEGELGENFMARAVEIGH